MKSLEKKANKLAVLFTFVERVLMSATRSANDQLLEACPLRTIYEIRGISLSKKINNN